MKQYLDTKLSVETVDSEDILGGFCIDCIYQEQTKTEYILLVKEKSECAG